MSLHIVGAENLAQDQAVEVIVKFGRDKQPPYTPPTPKTIEITENGEHNVKGYDVADVDVPGIEPTGTLEVTANGTYDVTEYASANVNVAGGAEQIRKINVQNATSYNVRYCGFSVYDGRLFADYSSVVNVGETKEVALPSISSGVYYPLVFRFSGTANIVASGSIAGQATVTNDGFKYLMVLLLDYSYQFTITLAPGT